MTTRDSTVPQNAASQPAQAAVWMIGAIVSFTAMAVAGRALAGQHDTFEIMTYRSIIGLVLVVAVAYGTGTLGQINGRRLELHGLRNVCHFVGQNLWFFAVGAGTIPLSQVFALEFTTPIWAMILAAVFLAEPLTRVRVLAAALGFAGALIVVEPWASDGGTTAFSPALLAAALAAIGFAGAAICTRALVRTESITCVLFYLTLMQAGLGIVTAAYDGAVTLPTLSTLPWLALVAVCGLVAHFCLTKALSLAPASVVMPIDFVRLPLIALVGAAFYGEGLEWVILMGGALIFAANFINIRAEARRVADK